MRIMKQRSKAGTPATSHFSGWLPLLHSAIVRRMTRLAFSLAAATLLAFHGPAFAQQVELGGRPVLQSVEGLKPGQFVWNPDAAPNCRPYDAPRSLCGPQMVTGILPVLISESCAGAGRCLWLWGDFRV